MALTEPRGKVQQCRLAAAAGTQENNDLTRIHEQVDVLQNRWRVGAASLSRGLEPVAELSDLQQRRRFRCCWRRSGLLLRGKVQG